MLPVLCLGDDNLHEHQVHLAPGGHCYHRPLRQNYLAVLAAGAATGAFLAAGAAFSLLTGLTAAFAGAEATAAAGAGVALGATSAANADTAKTVARIAITDFI